MAYEYTRESFLFEDVCCLCKPTIEEDVNGIQRTVGLEKREVYCKVGALYAKEFYDAWQSGIQDALKFVVNVEDWREGKEKIIEYEGDTYTVYRKFYAGDSVELYGRLDVGTWN